MNDLRSEPVELNRQELAAMQRVLQSGWYILGSEVESFETNWSSRCGVPYTIGVGNGMDALEIGLRALGIGAGDEVITTPMTAFATVLAVIRAGAEPVFADIDSETALLDPFSVERCLTARTKAVILVHLYGQVRNMERWIELCKSAGISLLEDCAQAHAAMWRGRVAGTFGEAGAYSFYPTKNLGAMGDGGALITARKDLVERARMLRNYGQSERYHHPAVGLNSRLDEMQAAILNVRLGWLDAFTRRRREIAGTYISEINNPRIRNMEQPEEAGSHVYHLYVVRCEERDRLSAYLMEQGISSLIHYPIPAHLQPPCGDVRRDPQGLEHAEKHARCCLSLPIHPQLSDTDVSRIVEALNAFR